jgi:hypothetical protein
VSKGAKQDRQKHNNIHVVPATHHMYDIVVFGGSVLPLYSHHMYVIVVISGSL